MITNITNSNKKISPFGGLFFVINDLKNKGIAKIIDSHLGKRVKQAKYSYSDILLNWAYCNLCGAERLEDIEKLRDSLDMKLPSHDALGTVMKSFAMPTDFIESIGSTGKTTIHQFSLHNPLNKLMIDTSLKLGLLNKKKPYILDYDNTIIEHQKCDKKLTYKMIKGYQPGVCFINKVPVYIENHNGNSNASYRIAETVGRSLELLKQAGIKIKKFRSDSAAYVISMFKLMDANRIDFFIRARQISEKTLQKNIDYRAWKPIQIKGRLYDTQSIEYSPALSDKKYRLVIYKTERKDIVKYLSIITSNWEMTELDIIKFYNQRGAIERNFDDLKNNFNWHHLPFSFLNENTVFMIISAIVSIIYQYLIRKFSKKVDFVKINHRLKNFIYHFITCSAILEDGQIQMFTERNYRPLME